MKKSNLWLITAVVLLFFTACSKDNHMVPSPSTSNDAIELESPLYYTSENYEIDDLKDIFVQVDKQYGSDYSNMFNPASRDEFPDEIIVWPGIFDMWDGSCNRACRKCPCMIDIIVHKGLGNSPGSNGNGNGPGNGNQNPGKVKRDVIVVTNPAQLHKNSKAVLVDDQQSHYTLDIVAVN